MLEAILHAGRRERDQWRVGDVHNSPGRSLYVRLAGPVSGKAPAGRWRDAATGEHGDLIDLIKATCRLPTLADALVEARRFLGLPRAEMRSRSSTGEISRDRYDPRTSMARLIAESSPLTGTIAETYLRRRGIDLSIDPAALRFHPHCPYREAMTDHFTRWPALIALVTQVDESLTGIQRTYLSANGNGKADLVAPRRSLGKIRSQGVRFGVIDDVAVFGEGVETVLSLKCALPNLAVVAALSADNLGASALPPSLRRLYVAVDRDDAGFKGADALCARAKRAGLHAQRLMPVGEDFNADLMEHGVGALRSQLASQITPEDRLRFGTDPDDVEVRDADNARRFEMAR